MSSFGGGTKNGVGSTTIAEKGEQCGMVVNCTLTSTGSDHLKDRKLEESGKSIPSENSDEQGKWSKLPNMMKPIKCEESAPPDGVSNQGEGMKSYILLNMQIFIRRRVCAVVVLALARMSTVSTTNSAIQDMLIYA